MGGWLSKKSGGTGEVLERLNKEIGKLEGAQRWHTRVERRVQSGFLFYGTLLFLIALAFGVAYFYTEPTAARGAVAFSLVSLAPILVYALYRIIRSIRSRGFERRTARIRELSEKMQEILDEVAEKETYKKAKELIERYGNRRSDRLHEPPSIAATFNEIATRSSNFPTQRPPAVSPISNVPTASTPKRTLAKQITVASSSAHEERANETLRRRAVGTLQRSSASGGSQPNVSASAEFKQPRQSTPTPTPAPGAEAPASGASFSAAAASEAAASSVRSAVTVAKSIFIDAQSAVRPLFNADRSMLERLTDLLLGDGPDSRFALICTKCYAHNGMALPDEFAHITFRCPYCGHLNPARAPRVASNQDRDAQVESAAADSQLSNNGNDHDEQPTASETDVDVSEPVDSADVSAE